MSGSPLLLPNLGAEEGAGWERMLKAPRVASAARLWEQLFPARARMLDGYLPAREPAPGRAPEAGRAAAFEWLQDVEGCVPWLADSAAWKTARAAGLDLHGSPGDVVRRVNDKAFALEVAEVQGFVPRPLRGASVVLEPDLLADPEATLREIRETIDRWPTWARDAFTLKPRFGSSGRGRIDGAGTPELAALQAGLPKLRRAGGAIFEPWVQREVDLSAQLRVTSGGEIVLLGTLEQRTSRRGGVFGHRGEIDASGRIFSGLPEDEDLREAAAAVALAAGQCGYAGPCGVDAFTFRWNDADDPRRTLRPIVELNARFTMGTVTVGLVRRRIDEIRKRLGLRPGDRRAFELRFDTPGGGWEAARDRAGEGAFVVPLHDETDAVKPAILFATSRANLEHALDGEAARPPGTRMETRT